MRRLQSPHLAALGALCLFPSCLSYTTSRPIEISDVPGSWDRLPYHVAIIPLDSSEATLTTEGADRSGAPFQFEFADIPASGHDVVTQSLRDSLAANSFRKVTVLEPPSTEELAALGDDLLSTYWVTAAREAKADLLLDIESFTYPVRPTSSGKIASYVLFLLGPVELLFPDREYSFDEVNLAVSLYDVWGLDAPLFERREQLSRSVALAATGGAGATEASEVIDSAAGFQLGDGAGTLRRFRLSPGDLKYRFGDRLGKGPASASFWKTLIIPSALLQRSSKQFSERLTRDAALALGHDLSREIVEGDYEYIVQPSSSGAGLLFDARDARLTRSAQLQGVLELRARIRKPASSIDQPVLWVAGRRFEIELDAPVDPQSMGRELEQAFQRGSVLAITTPISGVRDFDHTLVVYLPDPSSERRLVPAAAGIAVSPSAPIDVVQLRLGERLGARGNRAHSWTFGLENVVDRATIEALRESRSPLAAESGDQGDNSMRGN